MTNIFVDTNILIDFIADRKPFSKSAAKLFDYAEKGKVKLFVSALSYSNVYYVVKKAASHKEMITILRELESMTETLDVTKAIIKASLNADFKDYEDAIQYCTALSKKRISAIVTRNTKDYKNSNLAVLTSDEVISG